jgi:hypothetical protein
MRRGYWAERARAKFPRRLGRLERQAGKLATRLGRLPTRAEGR